MNNESRSHLLLNEVDINNFAKAARGAAKAIFEGLTERGVKQSADGYIAFNQEMLAVAMGVAFELAIDSMVQVMKGDGVVN